MNTGVFIRHKVDGKWDSYDLGTLLQSDREAFLASKEKEWIIGMVEILIERGNEMHDLIRRVLAES